MVDETMSDGDARKIIQGSPDPLNSAFHITYNMLLNLMRVEGINPEYMIERSFFQFQNQAFVPEAEESKYFSFIPRRAASICDIVPV